MSTEENPIKAAIAARKRKQEESETQVPVLVTNPDEIAVSQENELVFPVEPKQPQVDVTPINNEAKPPIVEPSPVPRKRGRPATGKRSDNEWIGRTFYIKRETDLDVEELLLRLKRQGVDVDKSELVERLLAAMVKWHNGENLEIHLSEISPIHKSRNSI